jgi:phytoene dehydrogenase-like protein
MNTSTRLQLNKGSVPLKDRFFSKRSFQFQIPPIHRHHGSRTSARRPTPPFLLQASSTASSPITSCTDNKNNIITECDVVVIGSGIGGLSCASLLARYGLSVIVCESHTIPGGAAHAWTRDGYHFESGPSLYSGMAGRGPAANPLALVLQAIHEPLELLQYNEWNVLLPEVPQGYAAGVGPAGFDGLMTTAVGEEVLPQLRALQDAVVPLARAATALPPAALRLDPGVVISALSRYFSVLLPSLPNLSKLTAPFSLVMDSAGVTDKFLRNYIDLLCFLLSGLPAEGTITAEVAFMMKEWFDPNATLEFPKGGSQAMVDALVNGVVKHGKERGQVRLGTHVEEILLDPNSTAATGVSLRNGEVIYAKRAVVSNASTPDTLNLLLKNNDDDNNNNKVIINSWKNKVDKTPLNPSFMHLHLGFDATGLENVGLHHIVVNDWDVPGGVTAPDNVILISIPSVIDPSLAPPGKHSLHAYFPATERWAPWEGLDRKSEEYKLLKKERSKALWAAVEKIIPDIRSRIEVELIGTPLTHARFLKRHKGSYGPAWRAGEATFPFGTAPVKNLYCCGDCVFPGIGLPAVAASGAVVANTLVPLKQHLELLDSIGL